VIVVAALPSREPGVIESEEIAAVAAAVQNMLLAAEALGLGAMWRTGEAARDPRVREHLGLPAEAHLVAFVYVGYTEHTQRRTREGDGAAFTTWKGSFPSDL
jgi:nitroreductase